MLPMIVSVCLSKGAIGMSRKKVIVKRLHSIQNLGAMDVLCSDKTGTLTQDRVILEQHSGVDFQEYDDVVNSAYLISHFQTGLKNLLDQAILQHFELHDHLRVAEAKKVDEIPFDFSRRMMSVVIEKADGVYQLLSKGAPEEILKRSTRYDLNGKILPMTAEFLAGQKEGYERLNSEGFRVLAVAYRDLATHSSASKLDESELILQGYLAFLDPPKETAGPALAALQTHGIQIKVLTGDSHLVTLKVCKDVGLKVDRVVRGDEVEAMTDVQLCECVEHNNIFARLSPAHKRRIIEALKARGHVVGFLGDGINDSPALRASDVGISVDSAVDIAKESADIILLEKNLLVLVDGVMEGRKVFVNILKYVRMGASSNFGNMFSVLGASIALPFVPMAPIQILTNNLLYDFSQIAIPTDSVDDELILKPRPWVIDEITRFMLFVGPISSIFDYSTFALMYYVFDCRDALQAPLFQTGWFIESLMTQTLIIHIIRTNRIPFLRSRPSTLLVLTTISILLIGAALPYSPLAGALGFVPLPQAYWPYLLGTLLCYALLTLGVKRWMLSRRWIS
jgi:Mg2+-importing ATPase